VKYTILEPRFTRIPGDEPLHHVRWNPVGFVEAGTPEDALARAKRLGFFVPIVEPPKETSQ
tara:strand:+ start:517 stop:699 length:183 start_codon:yes stop_codon:yes gene_type:complete